MTVVMTVLEILFVLAALAGVAMWSLPAALIVAGVLGVVAVERQQAGRPPKEDMGKEVRG
ncbi:hypothetical protein ACFVWX_29010 [Streptomyces sp. NPDC058220]|uniref:hypothetical protein n=1 Tax=Streptomyces sp. NPDC058220 TaxID=3346387 RepID=UPI0036EDB2D2